MKMCFFLLRQLGWSLPTNQHTYQILLISLGARRNRNLEKHWLVFCLSVQVRLEDRSRVWHSFPTVQRNGWCSFFITTFPLENSMSDSDLSCVRYGCRSFSVVPASVPFIQWWLSLEKKHFVTWLREGWSYGGAWRKWSSLGVWSRQLVQTLPTFKTTTFSHIRSHPLLDTGTLLCAFSLYPWSGLWRCMCDWLFNCHCWLLIILICPLPSAGPWMKT